MPTAITKAKIEELTLVFAKDPTTGAEFVPRNGFARVLSVKGGAKVGFLDKLASLFSAKADPEIKDDIDNDGDGIADYNEIAQDIIELYGNISMALCMSDDDAKNVALKAAIDNFLESMDDMRGMKAGARHSKMDAERIKNMGEALASAKDANDKTGKHLETASAAHAELMSAKPETQADKEEAASDKGDGEGEDDATKAAPIEDTPADVEYRVGIDISDKAAEVLDVLKAVSEHGPVLTGPVEFVKPSDDIADKLGSMLEAFATTFKADISKQLDDHTAAVDGKIDALLAPVTEELAATTEKLTAKTGEVSVLASTVKALEVSVARKSTSPGGLPRYNGETYEQSGFISTETKPVEITPDMPVKDAFRALLSAPPTE